MFLPLLVYAFLTFWATWILVLIVLIFIIFFLDSEFLNPGSQISGLDGAGLGRAVGCWKNMSGTILKRVRIFVVITNFDPANALDIMDFAFVVLS